MNDLTTHDFMFLSLLAGDKTTYSGGWGAWMTACGESCKASGHAEGLYDITPKGLEALNTAASQDKG